MSWRRAALLFVGVAAASCSDARTSVELEMSAPGLTLSSLDLIVGWGGQTRITSPLPTSGGQPKLPATVLLLLPDTATTVEVTLDANDETFGAVHAESSVTTRPHHQVKLPMVLTASPAPASDLAAPDLAAPEDLSTAPPADMAMSMDDLTPPPDLKPNPLVQLGAISTGGSTLSATLPGPSRAGTLLLFTMAFDKNADPNGPAGWARYSSFSGANDAEIWYLANNTGGIINASATLAGATSSVGQMSEWSVGQTFDVGAYCNVTTPTPSPSPCDTNTSTGMHNGVDVGHAGELSFTYFSILLGSAGPVTITPGSGWTVVGDNGATSTKLHYQFSYQLAPPTGMPLSEGPSSSVTGSWAGALVSFY
jgi:hypothetical protein